MSFIDSLIPKDTEEIKPGLFIQKIPKGYRTINPMAWDGKFRTKEQLATVINFKTIFTLALILFIAYNYQLNTAVCEEFQSDPCKYLSNYTTYCRASDESIQHVDFFNLKNGTRNTNTLSGYP